MAAPVLDDLARRNAGKLLVLKVDVDREQAIAGHMRIQGIPAFVLFHGGHEVARRAGLASRQDLEAWIAASTRNAA
jgi:thioredoxin 2